MSKKIHLINPLKRVPASSGHRPVSQGKMQRLYGVLSGVFLVIILARTKKEHNKKNVMEQIVFASSKENNVFFLSGRFWFEKLPWMLLSLCLSKRFLGAFQCSLNSACFFGERSHMRRFRCFWSIIVESISNYSQHLAFCGILRFLFCSHRHDGHMMFISYFK